MTRIGLCMIVKDEARLIRRCLDSVRPLVDYVLVSDTGSTDGTQELVRAYLAEHELPGRVTDEPWRDFAHNRSVALAQLREQPDVDYALVMDADDVLVVEPGFDVAAFKASLACDLYSVELRRRALAFTRPLILSNRLAFRYRGVVHEFVEGPPQELSRGSATGLYVQDRTEGARSGDPEKYRKDAQVLARALQTETDAVLRTRYTFYLAKSYEDSGEPALALEQFRARGELGGWDQEVFVSLDCAARLEARLEYPVDAVLATFARATAACPTRAEALHGASVLCREHRRYAEGYALAQRGAALACSEGLFVVPWIYEYGLLDELAVHAYWTGRYAECIAACERLLLLGDRLPAAMRPRVVENARLARERLDAQPRAVLRVSVVRAFNVTLLHPPGYVHALALDDAANYLAAMLSEAGYAARRSTNHIDPSAINVTLCSHLLHADHVAQLPAGTIVFNSEPLGDEQSWQLASGVYRSVLERFHVWDYSQTNVARLPHTRASVIPFGYSRMLARAGEPTESRDGLLFYGAVTERRRVILEQLRAAGVRVLPVMVEYGAARNARMRRAQAVLNLHQTADGSVFQPIRCFYPLLNEVPVISEETSDPSAQLFREAMTFVATDDFVGGVVKALADREALAARARTFAGTSASAIGQLRAAVERYVELARRPG